MPGSPVTLGRPLIQMARRRNAYAAGRMLKITLMSVAGKEFWFERNVVSGVFCAGVSVHSAGSSRRSSGQGKAVLENVNEASKVHLVV